jgi:hypothetical protein
VPTILPGICGGLAIVTVDDGAAPRLIDVIDIPVTGTGPKERVDAIALRAWIVAHKPQHAYIERAQAMPKQGTSNGFKYGWAVGAIKATIALCEIPVTVAARDRASSAYFPELRPNVAKPHRRRSLGPRSFGTTSNRAGAN